MPDKGKSGSNHYIGLAKRLFNASVYMTGAQILLTFFNYSVVALLARHLSLKELGTYFVLTEVGRIGSIFCQAGAVQSTQKFLGRTAYNDYWSVPIVQRRMLFLLLTSTTVTLALSASCWAIAANGFASNKDVGNFVFLGCAMIIVTTFNAYHSSVLRAIDKMAKSVLSLGLLHKALFLMSLLWHIFDETSPLTFNLVLTSWITAGAFSVLMGGGFVHFEMAKLAVDTPQRSRKFVSSPGYKELFWTSLPMGVASGMATLRNSMDVIIAGAVLGPVAAGIYGPCRMLANLVSFVRGAVGKALPATVAAGYSTLSTEQLETLCRRGANYGLIVAAPLGAILVVGGGFLLEFGFGDKLAGHGVLLAVLVLGPLGGVLVGAPGPILQVLGRHRLQMYVVTVLTMVSLALMPFVAHLFGLIAMGIVSSSILVIQSIVMCYLAWKKVGVKSYVGRLGGPT